MDEARQRANTIVAAKFDEIDKELELRLHLHEPRYKRAEMDIHHVRAGKKIIPRLHSPTPPPSCLLSTHLFFVELK
jgi:hypothetical protein